MEADVERETAEFKAIMTASEQLMMETRLLNSYLSRVAAAVGEDTQALKESLKTAIVTFECAQLKREAEESKSKAAKDIADLSAMVEETRMRISELKKEAYEFKRDIVLGGEDARSKKIVAERIIRYYEEKLRSKETLIEKLKLKNTSLKNHIQKTDAELRQKEEQGESLHSIDFHQLKIENSQFNQKIREKNAELLRLKMTTGKTVQRLNDAKKTLGDLLQEGSTAKREISAREQMLERLTAELSKVEEEVKRESRRNAIHQVHQPSAEVPQVLDYISQAAKLQELLAAHGTWTRKCEIAEMAARRARAVAAGGAGAQAGSSGAVPAAR